ncbi:MAG TPA: sensor histidine kinase [Vicinamibacterales bacterium]|nr:sensor histidine kinase [Vicinamibacterales bacterium]
MIDVTERRRLEAERNAAAQEQAALASRLISIQDEERQRIARDLHDNLGQQVTALRLLLDALTTSNGGDAQRVARAQSIVEQLDRQLDFLTTELRPNVLDLGAVSAIGQFLDEWSSTLGIAVDFKFEGAEDLRLKPEVETHLYRIVQEALNNIAKHAEARRVEVRVSRNETAIVLTIDDDGRGFNPAPDGQSRNRRGGLGLVSMRERARIINATFDIRSAPGEGATMTLRVPTRGGGRSGRSDLGG